jgi:Guanine nucleotide exchange factor in Golgi transport N-terminal
MLIVNKVVEEDRHMRPRFIRLEHFHKTFALEMIERVLTDYHQPTLPQGVSLIFILTTTPLLPLLLERLSDRSTFPLALRGMHIVFHLLE